MIEEGDKAVGIVTTTRGKHEGSYRQKIPCGYTSADEDGSTPGAF